MRNFFLQSPRLSYAQRVLPLFRMSIAGGVLVALALLAGFAAPIPVSSPRPAPPARGPLLNAAEHPEWKLFLVQAAYQRSDEIERLKELPDTPTIVPAPIIKPQPQAAPMISDTADSESELRIEQTSTDTTPSADVAALAPLPDEMTTDPTGSIDSEPGELQIDIGEASATELPITIQDLPLPIQRPQTLKRLNETHRTTKPAKRRHAKAQRQTTQQNQPAQQPDFFGSLFGGNSQLSSSPSH